MPPGDANRGAPPAANVVPIIGAPRMPNALVNAGAKPQLDALVDPMVAGRWVSMHGARARAWLDSLPEYVCWRAHAWGLSVEGRLLGGSVSVVVAARRGPTPVVLKVAPPWSEWFSAEAAALDAWHGGAAPVLLEREGRDLLLERILPGESPPRLSPAAVAKLVRLLSAAIPPKRADIPLLAEAVSQRFRRATENRHGFVDERQLERARRAGVTMANDAPMPRALLHGDLLSKNVLTCRRRGLVAIDPNPALGDIAYDLGLWAITESGASETRARCAAVAHALELDSERVWGWALVLSAAEICLAPRPRAEDTLALAAGLASWW